MRLPNKINNFNGSVISKFPYILNALDQKDITVSELYNIVRQRTDDIGDFLEILDCLYALGYVEYNLETRLIHYANRN